MARTSTKSRGSYYRRKVAAQLESQGWQVETLEITLPFGRWDKVNRRYDITGWHTHDIAGADLRAVHTGLNKEAYVQVKVGPSRARDRATMLARGHIRSPDVLVLLAYCQSRKPMVFKDAWTGEVVKMEREKND